jgi:hypothetical protein
LLIKTKLIPFIYHKNYIRYSILKYSAKATVTGIYTIIYTIYTTEPLVFLPNTLSHISACLFIFMFMVLKPVKFELLPVILQKKFLQLRNWEFSLILPDIVGKLAGTSIPSPVRPVVREVRELLREETPCFSV